MSEKSNQENRHYTEVFKRRVIEEYLRTGCAKTDLLRKHHIKMRSGIQKWMRQLGYTDIHRKAAYLGDSIILSLAAKKTVPDHPPSAQALEKRIKELERLLKDEQLRSEGYSRMIDYAEKELKVPIRKKPDTK